MGSSFGRSFDPLRLKPSEPYRTPGIGDGIQDNKRGFSDAFADIRAGNQDAGIAPAKRGGLFGSGMNGEDFINVLTRAAALAQGDYGGAAQIGQLIGKPKRDAEAAQAEREARFEDFRREFDYKQQNSAPDLPPLVRDAMAFNDLPPELRQSYAELERLRNPAWVTGADGLSYQRPAPGQLPDGLDPNEWEIVPGPQQGGPTPQASGNFPGLPPRRRYR